MPTVQLLGVICLLIALAVLALMFLGGIITTIAFALVGLVLALWSWEPPWSEYRRG